MTVKGEGFMAGREVNTLADGSEFAFWEKEVKYSRELYVAQKDPKASDENDGSREAPFKTIQAAAEAAVPGTRILIGPGEYHECVSPARGGDGPESMICYEAMEKGTVVIKASEEVKKFEKSARRSDIKIRKLFFINQTSRLFPFCMLSLTIFH